LTPDANICVISTANIPCQRRHWWGETIQRSDGAISNQGQDFPPSLEEAKELRLELMEERKDFVARHDEVFKQHSFSLCETEH